MSRHPALVLATRNRGKAAELIRLLSDAGVEAATLADFPPYPETDEDRDTLEGNARKKAEEAAAHAGLWALADDTGLEVDALGGAPGVHSARWAGPACSYADNCAKLLRELAAVPAGRRAARFRTVMALRAPDGREALASGELAGTIGEAARGSGGFGYDPLFVLPDGRTLAELSTEEKNKISHRGAATRAILPKILSLVAPAR